MTRNVSKRTFWHVSLKTQINLRIRNSIFVAPMKKLYILGYGKYSQWRFWGPKVFWRYG